MHKNTMSNYKGQQLVRLHDLKKDEYNGMLARVKSVLNPDGRYSLELLPLSPSPLQGVCVCIKPVNMVHVCHQCHNVVDGQLLQCSNCKIAIYCSRSCQSQHWRSHKGECKRGEKNKTKIPLLFRLPRAWLVGFLSEWLEIADVGLLDTAMTMKKYREEFLQCVKEMRSNSVENYEYALSSGYLSTVWSYEYGNDIKQERITKDTSRLQWISARQIFIQSLFLNGKASDTIQLDFLLKLKCTNMDNLCHFLSTSSELRSVRLCRSIVVTPNLLHQIAQLCPQLEEFATGTESTGRCEMYNDRYGLPPSANDVISFLRTCSQLKNVSLSYRTLSLFNDADLMQLCDEFGHLFVGLDVDCPDYENGDILRGTYYSSEGLAHLIGSCPRLQVLGLNTNDDAD